MSDVQATQWRAEGAYLASSALVPGIPLETRQFLLTYGETAGSPAERLEQTRRLLLEGRLPQQARASRVTMANRIQKRLCSWQPPAWVLSDLIDFARAATREALQAALLLHVCRQDYLLYSLVQEVIVPRWEAGNPQIDVIDIQRYLDSASATHPEIASWTYTTRKKLCSTALSTLRDYGLLQGKVRKKIVEPTVPEVVAAHLIHLLRAEGVTEMAISQHADWRLWLWTPQRTTALLVRIGSASAR